MRPASLFLPAMTLTIMLAVTGCTSNYMAASSAGGAEIFTDTCVRCHSPLKGSADTYFELDAAEHNPAYVIAKVRGGSLRMPKFPGMTDAQLQSLAEFVVGHSRIAGG